MPLRRTGKSLGEKGRAHPALEKRLRANPDAPVKLVRKDLYRDLIALSSQDLLVFFGSFGIALFALGIYNITTVDSKG